MYVLKALVPLHYSIFDAVIETAIDYKTLYEESANSYKQLVQQYQESIEATKALICK